MKTPPRWLPFTLALLAVSCGKRGDSQESAPKPDQPVIVAETPAPSASVSAMPPAPAPSASADAASKPERARECSKVFSGSPDKWAARLRGAKSVKARDEILRELDMPLLVQANTWGANEPLAWSLNDLKLRKVPLASASPEDVWIEVWYGTTADNYETHAVRSAALVRIDKEKYCVLAGPSEEQRFADHACLGGPEEWPIEFSLLHVTDSERFTISAKRSSGRCDGCGRGTEVNLELFDVEKTSLVTRFEKQTDSLTYSGCPMPPETWNHAGIEYVGGFPKAIVVTDEVGCSDDALAAQSCTPSAEMSRWELQGDRYTVVSKKAVPIPNGATAAIPEALQSVKDDGSGRGFGNKCFELIKKKEMESAKAACEAGLSRATDSEIKGAIHYNLALIAEARSDSAVACKELDLSLEARPKNKTVQEKRAALCKK